MLKYYGADEMFELKGKTAIITGGAAGIGFATAQFFAKKGVNLVLADLNPKTNEIAKEISANAIGVSGDATKEEDRQNVLKAAIDTFGQVDILVNCAGIVALEKAELISERDWDRTMNINLKATFMMAQMVGKYFIENNVNGCIVNMASQAGVIALDKHVAYCASKGAIIAMPLRYNNDKRKKPLFSRGLSVCRHLFNSFSKLKCDEKIIEKRRLFH